MIKTAVSGFLASITAITFLSVMALVALVSLSVLGITYCIDQVQSENGS